jgi:transposase-like protein
MHTNNYFKVSSFMRSSERFFFFNDRDKAAAQQAYERAKEYWQKFNSAQLRLWRKTYTLTMPMNQLLAVGEVPNSVPVITDLN